MVLHVVMASDCYVATWWLLHYVTMINQHTSWLLVEVGFCWLIGQILVIFWIPFCGSDIMDHFMCEFFPWIACIDSFLDGLGSWNGAVVPVITVVMLLVSSMFIQRTQFFREEEILSDSSSIVTVLPCSLCLYFYNSVTGSYFFPWRNP